MWLGWWGSAAAFVANMPYSSSSSSTRNLQPLYRLPRVLSLVQSQEANLDKYPNQRDGDVFVKDSKQRGSGIVSRADVAVVMAGLAPTRSSANRLIKAGLVLVESSTATNRAIAHPRRIQRPAELVSSLDKLRLAPEASSFSRFVSRAGGKLRKYRPV